MNWNNKAILRITEAGNTGPRCLFALQKRGFDVRIQIYKKSSGETLTSYEAHKEGRFFRGRSPEALLGIAAMWETRGDSWEDSSDQEWKFEDWLHDTAEVIDDLED